MRGAAKLVQDLRSDELMNAEFRSAVHDSMAYGYGSGVKMVPEFRRESGEGIALRFVDTFALNQCFSIGRTNME